MAMKRVPMILVVLCLWMVGGLLGSLAAQDPDAEGKPPAKRPELQEEELTRPDSPRVPERAGGGYVGSGAYSDRDWRMISMVHGYDHGYIDGYELGRRDQLDKRAADPFGQIEYREAARGFEERF